MFKLTRKGENALAALAFLSLIMVCVMLYVGKPKDPLEREMKALAGNVKTTYRNLPNNNSLSSKALQIASKDKQSFKVLDPQNKLILLLINSENRYKIYHVNSHEGIDITECTYDKETCKYSISLFKKEDYE